jgi:hypothetical protein
MKSKLSLILISFLSMINSVSASNNFWDFEVNFWFIKDVSLWVLIFTWGILFMLLYKLIVKLPMFNGDNKNAAILAVLISFASMLGSPLTEWMMMTVALSPIIIFVMFFLMFVWTAISYFHKGVAEGHSRMMETHKDWTKDKLYYKKEQRQAKKELSEIDEVIKEVKNAEKHKDTADFNEMIRSAISHLEHVLSNVVRSINLENKRFKAEHDDAVEDLKDLARKARADIEDALDALHNKRPRDAEKDLKRAKKKIKIWRKRSKKLLRSGKKEDIKLLQESEKEDIKLLQEGKGDTSEIIDLAKRQYSRILEDLENGHFTQEQAQDSQEGLWKEFSNSMKKLGYNNDQIKEYWEKEIWSQGHVEESIEEGKPKLLEAGNFDNVIQPYKDQYNEMLKNLKEGKYTQEQAKDFQEKIWKEFTKALRKEGYNNDQIKEYWEKEIWSQGQEQMSQTEAKQIKQKEDWQKMLQKKVNNTNSLFKVDLVKHPKKAKNYIKDIRNDIDQDLMDAATSKEQQNNLNSYMTQFDQILDFFEHQKKPHEAYQRDWDSIMNVATAYKNFLLALRDNI